eukprot:12176904-Heterocapsa_arctica.AAC.1
MAAGAPSCPNGPSVGLRATSAGGPGSTGGSALCPAAAVAAVPHARVPLADAAAHGGSGPGRPCSPLAEDVAAEGAGGGGVQSCAQMVAHAA